ncbi:MAG: hypothetical protein GX781_02740 [Clostridiales bacterium]|nr:hypothetical protein [Clostridiales bacterium]
MMKKLASFLMALILMTAFYLYALLREDEGTKGTDRWVVASEESIFKAQGSTISNQAAALSAAMGVSLPLPNEIISGEVTDGKYHGYYVRELHVKDEQRIVRGVRPVSAAPMLRDKELAFSQSDKTLMSYPLLFAQQNERTYYYFSTDSAAFVIEAPAGMSQSDALEGITMTEPK